VTDPSFIPVHDRELLAVFPDAEHAHDARGALISAGVPEGSIRINAATDAVDALRAEQHDELSRAWVVPNAGVVYPGGSARGLAGISLLAAVIAVPAALLLALIDFGPGYWVRALILVVVGLALAFTLGIVIGPPAGAPAPREVPDTTRGVTLRVAGDTAQLRHVLAAHDPIRVAEVTHDGDPIDTVARQKPDTAAETAKDVVAKADGDDYHPER
jgi:hypothetical protein